MKSLLKQIVSGAMLLALPLMLTGCEDILGEWERPTPVVPSTTKTPGTISYATTTMLKGSLDPTFSNTLTQVGDGSITYQSSDPSVATVDASTGKVTPVAPGTVTIKAIVSDSETYTYASKEASYTLEFQDGYSYRFWNTTTKQFETAIKPSSECELITSSTTTFSGKRYIAIGNVTIDHDINVTGVSGITLCDNAELTINGRLHGDKDLLIFAQSEGDEVGKLNVTSSTGVDGQGVVDCSSDLTVHGGKIVATATGNSNHMFGIHAHNITIYGGEVKGQGNEANNTYTTHGILGSTSIAIHGGKVEGIGGNITSGSYYAGYGIVGAFTIDGDAIVIATGGNASYSGCYGGHGLWNNNVASTIGGNAKVTATGGNSSGSSPGAGIECSTYGATIKDNAQVMATGGDHTGTNYNGGSGILNGELTLQGQASLTAAAGKSSGNIPGIYGLNSCPLKYYGGTFTVIGGAKGPTGSTDGKAAAYIYNYSSNPVTFEQSDDGVTWTTFDITAGGNVSATTRYVRKTN